MHYTSFTEIFNKQTPKYPKTLNFRMTNFFIKGHIFFTDTQFTYLNIGLKNIVKIPNKYCIQLSNKNILIENKDEITKLKIKIRRLTPTETETFNTSENIKTTNTLNFAYWKRI